MCSGAHAQGRQAARAHHWRSRSLPRLSHFYFYKHLFSSAARTLVINLIYFYRLTFLTQYGFCDIYLRRSAQNVFVHMFSFDLFTSLELNRHFVVETRCLLLELRTSYWKNCRPPSAWCHAVEFVSGCFLFL